MKKESTKTTKKVVKKSSPRKATSSVVSTPVKVLQKINFTPVIILVILALLSYSYYRFGIVAMVNGRPISRLTYLKNLEKQDKKQSLTQMVNESLVFQEAAKQKIIIDQATIDEEIKKIEDQVTSQGQTIEAALAAEGMTRDDLENEIRLQKTVEKLADPKVEITQEQIDKFLVDYKTSLPESATKEELQTLAKNQLTSDAQNEAINTWFKNLKDSAKIIIR
ncbi:SurA N-terminal domain-containing protein [Patescibacteria group bacterium]|nr:SurA N-terminal domain-containing protein [Patescibacteria group bacterium]